MNDSMHIQRPPVAVVIPVYLDLEVTRRCIDSVLDTVDVSQVKVVVVNDASPDAELSEWCNRLRADGRVTLLRNDRNVGFVATANRGMKHCPECDIVLLNSDTEVANDWLQRLADTAYAAPDIATVTPFSNNATICSYPYPEWERAELPGRLSLQELDWCFQQANGGAFIDIPTAVGFCMYIRRAVLNEVGYFDEESFGRGYGEENDFCRRALAAGWRNVLAAGVFVYHQGSVSFGADKAALSTSAMTVIEHRFPDYLPEVRRFIGQDPVRPLRNEVDRIRAERGDLFPVAMLVAETSNGMQVQASLRDLQILNRDEGITLFCESKALHSELKKRLSRRFEVIFMPGLWAADGIRRLMQNRYGPVDYVLLHAGATIPLSKKPALLHVMHSWGGGVERWVTQFCKSDVTHKHYVLSATGSDFAQGERLQLRQDAPAGKLIAEWRLARPIRATALSHAEYRQVLQAVISLFSVARVAVSSLIGHALDALETGLPTIWVAHDHYPWCTSIVQYYKGVCEQCDYKKVRNCLQDNEFDFLSRYFTADEALLLRYRLSRLAMSDKLCCIAPTQGVIDRIGALVPGMDTTRWKVIPHGIGFDMQYSLRLADKPPGSRKRALVLGRLHPHKGLRLLQQTLPRLAGLCDIVLLGSGVTGRQFESIPGIRVIPEYAHDAMKSLLDEIAPDFAIFTSIVPETFSYTLSEVWAMGIPPVATDTGAFHERISDGEDGLLYEPDADSLVRAVHRVLNEDGLLEHMVNAVRNKSPVRVDWMVARYRDLFWAFLITDSNSRRVSSGGCNLSQFRLVCEALASPVRGEMLHGIEQVEALRQELRICETERQLLVLNADNDRTSKTGRLLDGMRRLMRQLPHGFGDKA